MKAEHTDTIRRDYLPVNFRKYHKLITTKERRKILRASPKCLKMKIK